jgi:hypothetical protein
MLVRSLLSRSVSPLASQKLVREYASEATRLRDLAVSVTTPRLKARLSEEDRLAENAKQGSFHSI